MKKAVKYVAEGLFIILIMSVLGYLVYSWFEQEHYTPVDRPGYTNGLRNIDFHVACLDGKVIYTAYSSFTFMTSASGEPISCKYFKHNTLKE